MRSALLILMISLTGLPLAGCGVKGDPIPYLEVVRRADVARAKTDAAPASTNPPTAEKTEP